MRTLMHLGLTLGLAVPLSACTLTMNFNECDVDQDCPTVMGSTLRCSNHICAVGTPKEQLCTQTYPTSPAPNAIPIGALVKVVSGNDGLRLNAMQLAIKEVNILRAANSLRPLVLHICEISGSDDDPLKAMKILTREKKVVAVVGPSSSASVFAIAKEVQDSGVPIVSPSATAVAISGLSGNGLFFRVATSDALQGPVLAQLNETRNATKMAVLYVDDPYGNGLKDSFVASLGRPPLISQSYKELAGDAVFLAKQRMDTQATVKSIISVAPDVVVVITNTLSDEVIRDFNDVMPSLPTMLPTTPPKPLNIVAADGAKNDSVLGLLTKITPPATAKAHMDRLIGTSPTIDTTANSLYVPFTTSFYDMFGPLQAESSIYTFYAYDATYAIAIAIGNQEAPTPASVSEFLLHFNGDGTGVTVGQSNYLTSAQKVAAGNGLSLKGTTGTIRFTPHGDRIAGLYEVWGIDTATMKFKTLVGP